MNKINLQFAHWAIDSAIRNGILLCMICPAKMKCFHPNSKSLVCGETLKQLEDEINNYKDTERNHNDKNCSR